MHRPGEIAARPGGCVLDLTDLTPGDLDVRRPENAEPDVPPRTSSR
ncbi:hypothetical protein ACFPN7_11925 [Amycolatopsis halotolerans]